MTTIGSRKETQTTQQNHKQKCESHLHVRGSIKDQRDVYLCITCSHIYHAPPPKAERCVLQASAAAGSSEVFSAHTPHTDVPAHPALPFRDCSCVMSQHVHKQQVLCSTGQVRHLQLRCHCMSNCIFVLEFMSLFILSGSIYLHSIFIEIQ